MSSSIILAINSLSFLAENVGSVNTIYVKSLSSFRDNVNGPINAVYRGIVSIIHVLQTLAFRLRKVRVWIQTTGGRLWSFRLPDRVMILIRGSSDPREHLNRGGRGMHSVINISSTGPNHLCQDRPRRVVLHRCSITHPGYSPSLHNAICRRV